MEESNNIDKRIENIEVPKPTQKKVEKPKTVYQIKKKPFRVYFFSILTTIMTIVIGGVLIYLALKREISFFVPIIYLVFAIPLFLISSVIFWIKLFLDRKKISGFVLKKVSKNFVIANFRLPNKRKVTFVSVINKDGKTINVGSGLYMIDREQIYYDEDNHPNIDYFIGIPNPLKYNYTKYIEKYNQAVKDGDVDKLKDFEDETVDLSYSSHNLQKFKQDKIFAELHREKKDIEPLGLITVILLGVVLIIVIILVVRGSQ